MPTAGSSIFLNGNAIIDAQWPNWQIETNAKANVRGPVFTANRVRIGIDISHVVKYCPARLWDDGESKFHRRTRHGLPAERLAVEISGADIAEGEAAKVVRSAEIESIEDRHNRGRHRSRAGFGELPIRLGRRRRRRRRGWQHRRLGPAPTVNHRR